MIKKKVSFTLSEDAMNILKKLSNIKGISMSSCIEMFIRDEAKKEKIKHP